MKKNFRKQDFLVNKHRRRWSTFLVIRKMQIKTAIRYSFITIRMAKIKKTALSGVAQLVGALSHRPKGRRFNPRWGHI